MSIILEKSIIQSWVFLFDISVNKFDASEVKEFKLGFKSR